MSALRTDSDLHEQVNIARLLVLGGLAETEAKAWAAIAHGKVKVERWTIGVPEGTLPRWVLRGVSISIGERSIRISDDGQRIMRQREATLV